MNYELPLLNGRFISRYKRFFADIETENQQKLTLYCPNTGSLAGCLKPGSPVKYTLHGDVKKKLPGTLELIQVQSQNKSAWVGINTQRANRLTYEALAQKRLTAFDGFSSIESEVKFGSENSRVDFLLHYNGSQVGQPDLEYVEVKSVTFGQEDGQGYFPDAKTARGSKHLRELANMIRNGYRAALVYCVQHEGIESVNVAAHIDPLYEKYFDEAMALGLKVCAFRVKFDGVGLAFDKVLPI